MNTLVANWSLLGPNVPLFAGVLTWRAAEIVLMVPRLVKVSDSVDVIHLNGKHGSVHWARLVTLSELILSVLLKE